MENIEHTILKFVPAMHPIFCTCLLAEAFLVWQGEQAGRLVYVQSSIFMRLVALHTI